MALWRGGVVAARGLLLNTAIRTGRGGFKIVLFTFLKSNVMNKIKLYRVPNVWDSIECAVFHNVHYRL